MPELSVVVITADEDQRALVQVLVDGTAIARMTHATSYPQTSSDPIARRIQDLKADVIIVDLAPQATAAALHAIALLRAACPESAVVAMGEMTRPQLIVDAMRAGAQDFLSRVTSTDQLLDAFNRFMSSKRKVHSSGKRGRVFVFLNAKGGNGATTVAVNTAISIAASQGGTALLDMAPLGNAALHLNLKPGFTTMDALSNLHRLDASLLDGFMTRHESGLHLLAGHPGVNTMEAGPSDLARLFDLMVSQYRHLVVDVSTRLDAITHVLCDLSDMVLLVANPDLSSLWSAARVREFFAASPAEQKLRIVLNRHRKGAGFDDSDVEQATRAKILSKIPDHPAAIGAAVERGVPVACQNNSDIARSFANFGNVLISGAQPTGGKRWFFGSGDRLTVRTDP
jgi:pilus assembly protein CpaE